MTARGMTVAFASRLSADVYCVVHLLEVGLDSGTIYLTDAYTPLTWNGNTYLALGHFLQFDQVEETTQLQVNDTTVQLSCVDRAYLAAFLSENYINRPASIYLALLDANYAIVVDPIKVLQGRLDNPTCSDDPDQSTSTLAVRVVNQWTDYERITGRRTNNALQNYYFPGDLGFNNVSTADATILWGRAPSKA